VAVVAHGTVQIPLAGIAALRRGPADWPGKAVVPANLRHADEQTVVGLAAVVKALDGLHGRSFHDWGVVGAPRFPGRLRAAVAMERFRRLGASGVSPLIVPNLSLHALAAVVSMAVAAHGPNFGVGGGHGQLGEAMLTASGLLADAACAGIWLVLTEWDPEPVPDAKGASLNPAVLHGVALALVPAAESAHPPALELTVCLAPPGDSAQELFPAAGRLADLAAFLEQRRPGAAGPPLRVLPASPWWCPLPGGGQAELRDRGTPAQRLAG
jgi:hypothetical protein